MAVHRNSTQSQNKELDTTTKQARIGNCLKFASWKFAAFCLAPFKSIQLIEH